MAGRIRSIKPEILEDEKTAGLSHEAWRLFVSMWLLADDHGALRGEASWLDGQVFWSTPAGGRQGVDECVEELAAVGLVSLYEVRGQRYIQIAGWSKHQKVDHPGKPRVPRPDDPNAWPIRNRHPDRVYFIRAEKSRAVKIGVSWNPLRRLASLQSGHHERLRLEAEAPGDAETERSLHAMFATSRLSGEWFADSERLSELIESVVLTGSLDGALVASREPSRDIPRTLAPDLRSPTSDQDQRPATSDSAVSPRSKQARAQRIPEDWKPERSPANLAAEQQAAERGVDLGLELQKLHDWVASTNAKKADWNAAWRNWTRNAKPVARQQRFGGNNNPTQVALDELARLEREEMLAKETHDRT